jgi:hypothetical protein
MKTLAVILLVAGFFAVPCWQENAPTTQTVPPAIGLEIGQKAPAFALLDQFGHKQSSETLKGFKGTVLLFFRSADW